MIDFELPPAGTPYHLGFSLTDDFQKIAERLSTDPSMCDLFEYLRFIELGEYATVDMPGEQWPGKIERFCFINNRKQAVSVGLNPSLNGLGILNTVKRPAVDFTASRI